jgi:hypothetical protein
VGQRLISLADSTSGAVIYYTTDGTNPTSASSRYAAPIPVFGSPVGNSVTTTIKAIAVASGLTNSALATATYTITLATAATPSFSPAPGIYGPQQLVGLTDATPGTTIYYSIDGGIFSPSPLLNVYSGPLTLQGGSVNRVNAQAAADGFSFSIIGSAIYKIPAFPSDLFGGGNNFLYNNYAQQNSCAYYRAVGAETTTAPLVCNANGSFTGGITMSNWLSTRYSPLVNSGLTGSATFVNAIDLNFTRAHNAVWNQQQGANAASAAYVCNYAGPDFYHSIPPHIRTDLPAVDAAIDDAQKKTNPLPCVAIDYGTVAGLNNGQPFMRFLVFDPTGKLIPAVDLDGEGPKQIPNACSACHGIPLGAAVPAGSLHKPGVSASYIPFDEANLLFSNAPGLTLADQESQIRNLNLIVLYGAEPLAPGGGLYDLIHGWYDLPNAPLTSPTQQFYVPADLQHTADDVGAYASVYAPLCRSCHVANGVQFPGFPPTTSPYLRTLFASAHVCNPQPTVPTQPAIMPNAKVTFDRFWTTSVGPSASPDRDLPAFLARYLGVTCDLAAYQAFPNQIP